MSGPPTHVPWPRKQAKAAVKTIHGLSNVLYATIGEKRVAHQRTGEPAIVAYVLEKGNFARESRVPKSIRIAMPEGARSRIVASDVVEVPSPPRAFGVRTGHILQGFDGDIGVCGLVFSHGGQPYMLTNAHVVSRVSWNPNFGRVRLFNRLNQSFVDAGLPSYISPLRPGQIAAADVSAIAIRQDLEADEMRVLDFDAPIAGLRAVDGTPGLKYWYSVNGLIHECAFPEWVDVDVPTQVDGTQVLYTGFWQFQMINGAAMPGQSGALLCRTIGNQFEACGLVFGGVQPSYIWAFPIRNMLDLAIRGLPS
jgi:hypothetical protein